ncbi:zinc finger protein 64 isoform X2 [Anabrus simplex]|uniref:zinc finger protein 64 isoform X2 n=1 Tax=Anabrus simplex TaxID=316456 RepID=UPI0035A2B5F2
MNTAVSTLNPQVYVQLPDIEAHLHPASSSSNLEDVHICGTCKQSFCDINLFIEHKRSGCTNSPQNKSTTMAPSLTQSTVGYLTTATSSGTEDGMSIIGPPYLRVILDGGSLAVPQSNEHSQQDLSCEGNQESHILRSRLLGQHQVAVTVQQTNFSNSSGEMQTLVLQQQQPPPPPASPQQQQQEQQLQPQQHPRRDFHIDEEDVATLLANQFTNDSGNTVHGASISSSRPGLLSLENEIIIPTTRESLDLASISLSEGETGTLMLENNSKQRQNLKDRGKISSRNTSLGTSPHASRELVGARDKFWGQSNDSMEVRGQAPGSLLSAENSATLVNSNAASSPTRGKKRHDCPMDDCSFSTFYVKDLVRHMRKHTGERPFQCNSCQRSFSRGDKLQMHLRIHSGEKPHRCQQCDYATVDSGSLRKHMRIHNDERPFKCQICPYRSRDTSQLTVHLRTHTANLRVHVRLNHVEVKFINCSNCDFVATSKCEAKEHEKLHAGSVKSHVKKKHPDTRGSRKGKGTSKETSTAAKGTSARVSGSKSYVHCKPFCVKSHQCTFCDAAFVREDSWRCHMRQHQNQEALNASQTRSSEVEDRSTTAVEILSKAAAEVGAACDQERAVARMGNDDTDVKQGIVEPVSFLSIQMNEAELKGDRFGHQESHNNNSLHLDANSKEPNNSESFIRNLESEKNNKEPQVVQQLAKPEMIDASALQPQPVLLYLQNASVVEGTVGDGLRNAEILASLNQTSHVLVTGRCGQYLPLPVDQNNSLMEQLAASLPPGMQYVLSGPLEGIVGTETAFIQTSADGTTSTSSESTTVPLQSIISVHMDKGSAVSENH